MSAVSGAENRMGDPDTPDRLVVYTRLKTAAGSADAARLIDKASREGPVRVIVGLRMILRPEHTVSADVAADQRRALRRGQNAVAERILGRTSGEDIVHFDTIPFLSMWVDGRQAERLLADPDVVVIQEDLPSPPLDTLSVPLVHADDVWKKGDEGGGTTVAILDTGVAKAHPLLSGKVVSEACYSTNQGASVSSFCPGGATSSTAAGSGVNCPVALQGCDHGTHVASIAAAKETASKVGIAPAANIIAIQVFSKVKTAAGCGGAPPCTRTYDSDWIKGLERVYALRNSRTIAAANMSLGRGRYTGVCDAVSPAAKKAISNLRGARIGVLVASGNNGYSGAISFPACISSAIAVGATTAPPEEIAAFSNNSQRVKILAPGVDILAAVPPSGFARMSGTSMATPAVAGGYALMRRAKVAATVDEILTSLVCTAKILPVPNDGAPRIDLLGAYDRLLLPPQVTRTWPFDKTFEAHDWTPLTGNWSVQAGTYKEAVIKYGYLYGSSTDNCNHSLEVTAIMERVDPNEATIQIFGNHGVIIKSQIDYSAERKVSGYFVGYNDCPADSGGTCGAGTDPGLTFIFRLDSYSFTNNTGTATLLCRRHALSKPGGYNTVKVVSQGNTHTFSLNGKYACKATDATYTVGPVMVVTSFGEAKGQPFKVDKVTIKSLDSADAALAAAKVAGEAEAEFIDAESDAPTPLPADLSVLAARRVK